MSSFRAWESWAIYPGDFLIKLQNIFLGLVRNKSTAVKPLLSLLLDSNLLYSNSKGKRRDPRLMMTSMENQSIWIHRITVHWPWSLDYDDEEDIDGKPIAVSNPSVDDDIDGRPLNTQTECALTTLLTSRIRRILPGLFFSSTSFFTKRLQNRPQQWSLDSLPPNGNRLIQMK